ncbi:ASTRA complex subunit [Podochytrium sp. JEL0797]|nr:ASTRA complex subunit [Podochytrium sp. JEL0797]
MASELHTLRAPATTPARTSASAVCVFRVPSSTPLAHDVLPATREFVAVAHGLTTTLYGLRALRPLASLQSPNATDENDRKVTSLHVFFPLLLAQSTAYSLDVFDLNKVLANPRRTDPHEPIYSLPINSLNFCSLVILESYFGHHTDPLDPTDARSIIAETMRQHSTPSKPIPSLIMAATSICEDSDKIDIINLTSRKFIANQITPSSTTIDPSDAPSPVPLKTGMVMCVKLFHPAASSSSDDTSSVPLHLAAGYESGDVTLFEISEKGESWRDSVHVKKGSGYITKVLWSRKMHAQPVVSMDVYHLSSTKEFIITGGAEEFFAQTTTSKTAKKSKRKQSTDNIDAENSMITLVPLPKGSKGCTQLKVRDDGKVIALACWDSM